MIHGKVTKGHELIHITIWTHLEIHYNDVIMSAMASQITSLTIVYSTVYSGADQRRHQSSASLAFLRGIRRWPLNSPHKGTVTQKKFQFDDVIMENCSRLNFTHPLKTFCHMFQKYPLIILELKQGYCWIMPILRGLGGLSLSNVHSDDNISCIGCWRFFRLTKIIFRSA